MQEEMQEQHDVENMENLGQVSFEILFLDWGIRDVFDNSRLRYLVITNFIVPPTHRFVPSTPNSTTIMLVPDGRGRSDLQSD